MKLLEWLGLVSSHAQDEIEKSEIVNESRMMREELRGVRTALESLARAYNRRDPSGNPIQDMARGNYRGIDHEPR